MMWTDTDERCAGPVVVFLSDFLRNAQDASNVIRDNNVGGLLRCDQNPICLHSNEFYINGVVG